MYSTIKVRERHPRPHHEGATESINFAKQNPLQSYKIPHRLKLSGELLDKAYKSTENLVFPVFPVLAVAKTLWSDYCIRWMEPASGTSI